ncbi:MAG: cysteine--tRNA ligase [Candidatus Blackburnbacteria bacterium]|nr:cysteine--tRNA ligase [Candidatus Blackburnbacteria bacterium]
MLLYNTLTTKKEEFTPLNPPKVRMYTCGPTVHDYVHIGNLRAYVFNDILKRVLQTNGFDVVHVMNITNIEDKIIKKANEAGATIGEFTKKYEEAFFADIKKLGILPANFYPKATEYIPQMISLINKLLEKGVAYKAPDETIYFSIEKFPQYGTLSKLDQREIKPGARVAADEYTKENVQDFALWKAPKEDEPSWDAPFGKGRPGWHIECSAMSMDILGETLDLHAGGVDLIFPHHEDEIAQSEAATGKKFARFWVHNAHLMVDGKKMSKSLGNFYTLRHIKAKGFDPIALRYLFLTAHYRDPINFTWDSLAAAQSALERLQTMVYGLPAGKAGLQQEKSRTVLSEEKENKYDDYRDRFYAVINNDLGTPQALAILWEAIKSNIPSQDKLDLILSFDEVLGLGLGKRVEVEQVVQVVQDMIEERERLRQVGKWDEADNLRKKIQERGYEIEDTPEGPTVKRKTQNV